MATGAYLGSRAGQDVQRAEIEREAKELEENPAEEFAELMVIFQREGKTFEEARELADQISQDKELWLNTLIEKELGISPEDTSNPVKDALVMGAAFIIAASIPIIPYLFWSGGVAIGVSIAGGLTALFALGIAKGRIVQRSPLLQGLEILGIGIASAGIGFLLEGHTGIRTGSFISRTGVQPSRPESRLIEWCEGPDPDPRPIEGRM